MDFQSYITPELLVLIPVLYALGMALKKWNRVKDNFIPLLLGAAGVVLAALWVLATSPMATYQNVLTAIFTAIVQGALCAAAAVFANQIVVQGSKAKEAGIGKDK